MPQLAETLAFGPRSIKLIDARKSCNRSLSLLCGKDGDDNNGAHYTCTIIDFAPENMDLPNILRGVMDRTMFSGFYKDVYYSLLAQYGLIAISRPGTNATVMLLQDHLPSEISAYLIRSIIRQHTHRHLYNEFLVPLHASAVTLRKTVGIMIVGPSGSGKSSTVWHLLQAGYTLLTDDNVVAQPNGLLSGNGGSLNVRPDFLDSLSTKQRMEAKVVAPGRTYAINVCSEPSTCVTPYIVLLPKLRPEATSSIEWTTWQAAYGDILATFQEWAHSKEEHAKLTNVLQQISSRVRAVGYLFLGRSPQSFVEKLLRVCAI